MRNRYIFLETPCTREGGSENTYTMECGKFLDQVGQFIITFSIVSFHRTSNAFPGKLYLQSVLLTPECKKNIFAIIFADPDADLNDPVWGSASGSASIPYVLIPIPHVFLDETLAPK